MTATVRRVATWTVAHDPWTSGLDVAAYSRMKHGSVADLRDFGTAVGQDLVAQVPALVEDPADVVFPVAYLAVRPACWFLARHALDVVDHERSRRGRPPGRIVHVHKDAVTARDYATADAADRAAELASIGFTLRERLDGAQVVVVDDVRVTGSAERTIFAALAAAGDRPRREVAAYVAVMDGAAAHDPSIESRLNLAAAASLDDLAELARTGEMHLTIRMLKRVLGADEGERRRFLAECTPDLVEEMRAGALATGPAFVESYRNGVADLEPVPAT
ncbi:PRTase ComF-like [Paraoerskovia marina]|uniref:PRTase ComF-like n=1 Tax=Paraoerskovia marina TaxID=545619 RepID=A0A1H1NXV6_9CELL|nr:phosphoribosyltransferase family protein [Paraoerskovia marina]SDS03782.1 PRTase ComF-like [Paraoerskovia marina]